MKTLRILPVAMALLCIPGLGLADIAPPDPAEEACWDKSEGESCEAPGISNGTCQPGYCPTCYVCTETEPPAEDLAAGEDVTTADDAPTAEEEIEEEDGGGACAVRPAGAAVHGGVLLLAGIFTMIALLRRRQRR